MNKVLETINNRVSCRSYGDKKVPISKINQILEAGKVAPSGMNRQICHILLIKNKKLLETIREALIEKCGRDCLYGAPTLCLVYGPKDEPLLVKDASCILENMFIAATALRVDSCWINQLNDLLTDPRYIKLRNKLGLDDNQEVVGSIILGYRKDGVDIPSKPRKKDIVRII